jgi:hypothetical protein
MSWSIQFSNDLNPLAAYSAVVSTGVATWQVFTYFRERPRVRLRIGTNMKLVGHGHIDPKSYVNFHVTNIGGADTTITHVGYYAFDSWWSQWRRKAKTSFFVVTGPPGQAVPYVLEPGKHFSALSIQTDELVELSKTQRLCGAISHTMGKEILARIKLIEIKAYSEEEEE